ncbi:MAG: hypothetical protein GEV03_27920 [Streptosporangiales bacterium]|nr:hypothetical protein [Streptosporangiales bacterium]
MMRLHTANIGRHAEVIRTHAQPLVTKRHWYWNRTADPERVLHHYGDWKFDFGGVADIAREADYVLEYPFVDRDPLPYWSADRVTLLGDAAHPMYPTGSNGTAQAILDARVLSRELAARPDVRTALAHYERERLAVTSRIVRDNRNLADAKMLELVRQRAPNGFTDPREVISDDEVRDIIVQYQELAGFEPTSLNTRNSLDDE